jgi:hypothetical protein
MNKFEKLIADQQDNEIQKKIIELLTKYPENHKKVFELILEHIEKKK